MASAASKPELIVIVGPTASGKSELAMKIAEKYKGEIISADSRTLYKGMDIGTAKPSLEDQKKVKHCGLDLISPDEKFSAKQFKDYALKAIADIKARGKLPILVGGTGLYINAVIFDYKFEPSHEKNPLNPRHSLRKPSEEKPIDNVMLIGLDPGKEALTDRIEKRAKKIMGPKFIREVKKLNRSFDEDLEAFKAPGYLPVFAYLQGTIDLNEAEKMFVQNDLKLAKKQRTWFKRNKFILWYESASSAVHAVDQILNT